MVIWRKAKTGHSAIIKIANNLRYMLTATNREGILVELTDGIETTLRVRRSGAKQAKQWCEQVFRQLTRERGIIIN